MVTLALLLATVGVIGVTSYVSARKMAEDLSAQVLDQTAQRIDAEVHHELSLAISQATLDARLLASGQVPPTDKAAVTRYMLDAIRAHPQLSYLSWALEATGDLVNIERDRDGRLEVVHLVRQPDGRLELHRFSIAADGYTLVETEKFDDKPANDPRPRPYYVAAKDAHAPTWTETYVFLGKGGRLTVPGVTRATPIYGADGALVGVLSADFDLYALSEFLAHLELGAHGMAFLVELRRDGTRRVIAHPQPELLAGSGADAQKIDQIADKRVRGLIDKADLSWSNERAIAFDADGDRFIGSVRKLDGDRGLHWAIALALPEDEVVGPVLKNRDQTIFISAIATVVAILLAVLLSMQIGRALRSVAAETEAVAGFHLQPKSAVSSRVVEVRQLSVAIEDMKRGLRSFQKFVPTELVRSIVASGGEATLGGKRATITVHFSDIADFTTISEKLPPEQLVELLGDYLGVMSKEILASGGTIDKFIGDAIMAFWNAPAAVEDHAFVACKTVLANQRALAARREVWTAAGRPALRARVGLHTGEAVVGNIGTDARLDYTAIGDTVNLGSRLEGLNKAYGTEVLISETTLALVKGRVVVRPIDKVAVKGKATGVMIYELLGLTGEVSEAEIARAAAHAAAMDHYFAQRWSEATAGLADASDPAAALVIERCRAFAAAPPGDAWDGVHRMTTK